MKDMLLPGLLKQTEFLLKNFDIQGKNVLVIGGGSDEVAEHILTSGANSVEIIVEDYEQLLQSRINLKHTQEIEVKIMEFQSTDYEQNSFDLIFAQGSISVVERNKIIKELKRILKPGGFLCSGEIVKLKENVPPFVNNMFEASNLLPLFVNELNVYYRERKFELIKSEDLSNTLKDYYSAIIKKSDKAEKTLTRQEKSYYKKLLNRIRHESNVYLKMGGEKFIGFVVMLLQNKKEK
jgi:ubiquinone/menaquinone biosynthesis C-methylase UbiE